MEPDSPGLFDMDVDVAARSGPTRRGRSRQTWTVSTVASVAITDRRAVREAFVRQDDAAYTLAGPAQPDQGEVHELSLLEQVVWLVWPPEGLDRAIDADAFRVLEVEAEIVDEDGDLGTLRWAVTVKLRDVGALRRLAPRNGADDVARSNDDFAATWQRAIDPYAPISAIPGIEWRPGGVEVTHVPARRA